MQCEKILFILTFLASLLLILLTACSGNKDSNTTAGGSAVSPAASSAVSITESPAVSAAQNTLGKEAEVPSANPVSKGALPKYWKMGALNVKDVPYLPVKKTAEDFGYQVTEIAQKVNGSKGSVEYDYKIQRSGKTVCTISASFKGNKLDTILVDSPARLTHDNSVNKGVIHNDELYMPAQFFKEALDKNHILP